MQLAAANMRLFDPSEFTAQVSGAQAAARAAVLAEAQAPGGSADKRQVQRLQRAQPRKAKERMAGFERQRHQREEPLVQVTREHKRIKVEDDDGGQQRRAAAAAEAVPGVA